MDMMDTSRSRQKQSTSQSSTEPPLRAFESSLLRKDAAQTKRQKSTENPDDSERQEEIYRVLTRLDFSSRLQQLLCLDSRFEKSCQENTNSNGDTNEQMRVEAGVILNFGEFKKTGGDYCTEKRRMYKHKDEVRERYFESSSSQYNLQQSKVLTPTPNNQLLSV